MLTSPCYSRLSGKSLSLISSCLYWLLEHHPRSVAASDRCVSGSVGVGGSSLPSWVVAQTAEKHAAIKAQTEAKEASMREIVEKQNTLLDKRTSMAAAAALKRAAQSEEDEFLLDCSIDAQTGRAPSLSAAQELRLAALQEQQDADAQLLHAADTPIATKIRLLHARVDRSAEMRRLTSGGVIGEDDMTDMLTKILYPNRPRRKPQIIYASRTHSQLVQMVGEIKKLKYGRTAKQEKAEQFRREKEKAQQSNRQQASGDGDASSSPPPPPSLSPHQLANAFDPLLQAKVISLGSRANLCIRPEFAHLRSSDNSSRLNDACLDLQKSKSADGSKAGCAFLHPEAMEIFHDHVLAQIHDLEELEVKGKQIKFCPYYGSRQASPEADVIIVPYASLLSAATRASLQIDLQDAILVIDEAHNLHDTINDIYTCRLSARQLRDSRIALKKYLARYQPRLSPVNLTNVEILMKVCDILFAALERAHQQACTQYASDKPMGNVRRGGARELKDIFVDECSGAHAPHVSTGAASSLLDKAASASFSSSSSAGCSCSYSLIKSLSQFSTSLGLEDINYHHLTQWMKRSEICKKIKGFVDKQEEKERELEVKRVERFGSNASHTVPSRSSSYVSSSISPLSPVLDFLNSLSHLDGDGRVCVDIRLDGILGQIHPDSTFKFMMLNPAIHLTPILKQARTIILAGGTMQPFQAFKEQLFPEIDLKTNDNTNGRTTNVPTTPADTTSANATAVVPLSADPPPSAESRLHFFSCSHVIPPSHIQALILRSGVLGGSTRSLNFASMVRGDTDRMDDLAATIVNLINVIPQGVVVFFTSYAYAAQVFEYWSTHAARAQRVYLNESAAALAGARAVASGVSRTPSMTGIGVPLPPLTWLERLRKRKVIFRDAQGVGFEETLEAYTRIIQQATQTNNRAQTNTTTSSVNGAAATPQRTQSGSLPSFTDSCLQAGQTGAILFSVVGGKMSEGINFSDGLARSVMMVGVPYPNRHEPEMREKTAYADREKKKREQSALAHRSTSTGVDERDSVSAGTQLLQTLTMRAVNQSIGRAIRHARDYASILLLDDRYTDPSIVSLLPSWLKTDSFISSGVDFRTALKSVTGFFQDKAKANNTISATTTTQTNNNAHIQANPHKRKAEQGDTTGQPPTKLSNIATG